jgi:hypothetical protein
LSEAALAKDWNRPEQFEDFDPDGVRKSLEEFSFEIAERILHEVNSLVSNYMIRYYHVRQGGSLGIFVKL